MATRSTNTMQEGMAGLMQSIQEMKLMPDADLPWLINLETQIISKVQSQYGASNQVPPPGAPGNAQPAPMDPAMMAGMGGGGMPMPGSNTGSGVGTRGMQVGPAMPNPDEIRRMVGGMGVQGG